MDGTQFGVLDLAGRASARFCWRRHAGWPSAPGLVFVVDSSDKSRIQEAADGIRDVLSHRPSHCQIPLLVFLNKCDLPSAIAEQDACQALQLFDVCGGRPFKIQPCSAMSGEGIADGFIWLLDSIAGQQQQPLGPAPAPAPAPAAACSS